MKQKHTYVTKGCSICLMGPSGDRTSPAKVKHSDSRVTAHLTTTAVEPGNSAAKTQKQQGTQYVPWSYGILLKDAAATEILLIVKSRAIRKTELLSKSPSFCMYEISLEKVFGLGDGGTCL